MSAQTDLDSLFNDGGKSTRANLVKINFGALHNADLAIQYERLITDFFGIEIGVGRSLPYVGLEINHDLEDEIAATEVPSGGYSYLISARMYALEKAPEAIFYAPKFMYRQREYEKFIVKYNYYMVDIGVTLGLSEYFLLELSSSFGGRSSKLEVFDQDSWTLPLEDEKKVRAETNFALKLNILF